MGTITEDYVSFDMAKLLKEKGFNERTIYGYIENRGIVTDCYYCNIPGYPSDYDYNNTKVTGHYVYAKPTLQMVMKWLREVHNIFICIIPCEVGAGVMDYTYVLYKIDAKNFYFEDLGIQGRAKNISEISYEKTCEAAIKYCLENLNRLY